MTSARVIWRGLASVVVTAGVVVVAAGWLSTRAGAQANCAVAATAATAAELDSAIGCYNAQTPAGPHTITLAGPITVTGGVTEITQNDATATLTVAGQGHSITLDPDPRFSDLFRVSGAGPIRFEDVVLDGRTAVRALPGAGHVTVAHSTVTHSNYTGNIAFESFAGIRVEGGSVVVTNTAIGNNFGGLSIEAGSAALSQSTVTATSIAVSNTGGTVLISNSTLGRNGVALTTHQGPATVSNSTIADNIEGVRVTDASAPGVAVFSSLVVGSSADDCGGLVIDLGANFASDGTCGPGFGHLSPPTLGPLGDNGCSRPHASPQGPVCVKTVSPDAGSAVLGGGDCGGNPMFDPPAPAVSVDQRGVDRPTGSPCDSGAVEVNADPCAGALSNPTVATPEELDAAIRCYNAQTPPGPHVITLAIDIDLATGATEIAQPDVTAPLTIHGAGHGVAGPGPGGAASDLFTVSGRAPVTFDRIVVRASAQTAIRARVGAGPVVVSSSTIAANGWAGIQIDDGSATISYSTVADNGTDGVLVQSDPGCCGAPSSPAVIVSHSTIARNTGHGLVVVGGTAIVSSSTIGENGIGVWADSAGVVTIGNSTLVDNHGVGVLSTGSTVSVLSTVIAAGAENACAGALADLGGNFATDGSCGPGFGLHDPALVGPLADNGCVETHSTPAGPACVATAVLRPGSSAIDAGDCAGDSMVSPALAAVSRDQRGIARPSGPGCDSGSVELETAYLTVENQVVGDPPLTRFTFGVIAETAGCGVVRQPGEVGIDGSGSVSVRVVQQSSPVSLGPCRYTVTANPVSNFTMDPAAHAAIAAGATASFTATPAQLESPIIIEKLVVGVAAPTSFEFTLEPEVAGCGATQTASIGGAGGAATLTVLDVAGTSAAACTYTVTEAPVAGYSASTSTAPGVAPGQTISFTNTQLPVGIDLTIRRIISGPRPPVPFTFVVTPRTAGCSASLTATLGESGGSVTVEVADVAVVTAQPCRYEVTQTRIDGYSNEVGPVEAARGGTVVLDAPPDLVDVPQTPLSCAVAGVIGGATATVVVPADVAVWFDAGSDPTITIGSMVARSTKPSDRSFSFDLPADVAPGLHVVSLSARLVTGAQYSSTCVVSLAAAPRPGPGVLATEPAPGAAVANGPPRPTPGTDGLSPSVVGAGTPPLASTAQNSGALIVAGLAMIGAGASAAGCLRRRSWRGS